MVNTISTADFRKTWKDKRTVGDLTAIACKYAAYGPDYNRSIATSLALLKRFNDESTRFELALRLFVHVGK